MAVKPPLKAEQQQLLLVQGGRSRDEFVSAQSKCFSAQLLLLLGSAYKVTQQRNVWCSTARALQLELMPVAAAGAAVPANPCCCCCCRFRCQLLRLQPAPQGGWAVIYLDRASGLFQVGRLPLRINHHLQ
jgi:hypothetical protein